jgi:putative tryptophan/tyrosine transport system substrate-binding protein
MQFDQLKRREFITLAGGAAAAWPMTVHAQQAERMRRIGVLSSLAADDRQSQRRMTAFVQGRQFGWTDGRNVTIETRWGAGDSERLRRYAAELVALAPDVILAVTVSSMVPLQQATHTVPIVFVQVTDAVGAGFVESLSRPGGNATGFSLSEYGFSAKWLELLKEIAPRMTRAGVLRDPSNPSGIGLLAAIQGAAPALDVEVSPLGVRDVGEIERVITAFAQRPNGALILVPTALTVINRQLIINLAARHRLPAIYPYRYFVEAGGLMSYGADEIDQYRLAAGYVDRILKGEKPADLPVQAPTKFELVINLKTAKALGIDVPATVLARADEVIE